MHAKLKSDIVQSDLKVKTRCLLQRHSFRTTFSEIRQPRETGHFAADNMLLKSYVS